MAAKVYYEWDIETLDPDSLDVLDHDHADNLKDLVHWKESCAPFDIVLVRDIWDTDDGELIERSHWYPEHNGLEFSQGAKVPKRFIKEFKTVWE